jgi:molybdenum cofactor biosynthesis protein A
VKRQFLSAVAKEYSSDDEAYVSALSAEIDGSSYHMPRLHALREKLRLEKHKGHVARSLEPMSRPPENQAIEHEVDINKTNILTDTHGRHHNYLRISLSERCNLRCQYCMPLEGVPLSHSSKLLTDEEIIRLVRLFVKNGVNKIRLTGGEPLLRQNLVSLVRSISDALNVSDDIDVTQNGLVGITTNGVSLSRQIDALVEAGLTGVNISLDTLSADRFLEITRRNGLDKVMRAIGDSIYAFRKRYGDVRLGPNGTGGSRVKINCVVMKGFNDDELSDFVRMSNDVFGGDVDIRFIEWMPFNDNSWNTSKFVSYNDMMDILINEGMPLERIGDGPNDTTKWWRVQKIKNGLDRSSRVGFITSMSEHFCSSCNRLRITADGKIKVCLFGSNEKEVSLRDIMRKHHGKDDEEELGKVIHAAVQKKTFALGGHGSAENIALAADNRPMTLIGG